MATFPDTMLVHLSIDASQALLRGAELGRLGVVSDGRPLVFPVCHVYDGDVLAFPTSEGTKMQAALHWPYVAFEVDGIDDDGSGWSVMVTGRAEAIEDIDEQRRLASLRSVPWRNSTGLTWIRVLPEEITGRRIQGVRSSRG